MREREIGRTFWDEFAKSLIDRGRSFGVPDLEKEGYGTLLSLLPKGKAKMLDIGCGTGHHAEAFARKLPQMEVHGIELPDILVRAAAKHSHIKSVKKGAVEDLMAKNEFDFIFARDVLSYVDAAKTNTAFRNIHRALKEGGIFAFSFFKSDLGLAMAMMQMNIIPTQRFPETKLRTLLEETGFDLHEIRVRNEKGAGFAKEIPHFEVVAIKRKSE